MIPAVVGSLGSILSGGIKDTLGGVFGGGENTDPVARATADSFTPGELVRLGAPPKSLTLGRVTAAAPQEGTFYLYVRNGAIYQSRAAGFYLVTDAWAKDRARVWNAAQASGVLPADNPAKQMIRDRWLTELDAGGDGAVDPAVLGPSANTPSGSAILMIVAAAVAFVVLARLAR